MNWFWSKIAFEFEMNRNGLKIAHRIENERILIKNFTQDWKWTEFDQKLLSNIKMNRFWSIFFSQNRKWTDFVIKISLRIENEQFLVQKWIYIDQKFLLRPKMNYFWSKMNYFWWKIVIEIEKFLTAAKMNWFRPNWKNHATLKFSPRISWIQTDIQLTSI